jgi:hypothetical protein
MRRIRDVERQKKVEIKSCRKKIEFNNKTESELLIESPITNADSTIKSQVLFR